MIDEKGTPDFTKGWNELADCRKYAGLVRRVALCQTDFDQQVTMLELTTGLWLHGGSKEWRR